MKILKAIGAFFVKIWRWIKETAWVQPLLIVGAIFAIIFSIPYFTEWINSIGIGSENYYSAHKVSLEGELEINADPASPTSAVDKLIYSIDQNSFLDDGENYKEDYNKYGEKFFLVFVEEDCSSCKDIQEAFQELEDYWGSRYVQADTHLVGSTEKANLPFRIHTIFTDETSSTDDDDENNSDSAFQRHLQIYTDFYEKAGTRLMEQTPYGYNNYKDNSSMKAFFNADIASFATPTIVLVDYTQEARELPIYAGSGTGRAGISEILFSVSGTTKYEKAQVLMNMWNHASDDKSNPFTDRHYA
ncbi:MAG: hypothetical protein J6038_01405 [Bacilli bacterium]|nr:hypothetical protein [Bacilli bacterium]